MKANRAWPSFERILDADKDPCLLGNKAPSLMLDQPSTLGVVFPKMEKQKL